MMSIGIWALISENQREFSTKKSDFFFSPTESRNEIISWKTHPCEPVCKGFQGNSSPVRDMARWVTAQFLFKLPERSLVNSRKCNTGKLYLFMHHSRKFLLAWNILVFKNYTLSKMSWRRLRTWELWKYTVFKLFNINKMRTRNFYT